MGLYVYLVMLPSWSGLDDGPAAAPETIHASEFQRSVIPLDLPNHRRTALCSQRISNGNRLAKSVRPRRGCVAQRIYDGYRVAVASRASRMSCGQRIGQSAVS